MMKILAYIEPHPIRNHHVEFADVGKYLVEALLNAAARDGLDVRVFANHAVADLMVASYPQLAHRLLRPTSDETEAIGRFDENWDESAIAGWLDLVRGIGSQTELYAGILRRIHEAFPFDVIVLWAENGAARLVVREVGAVAIHTEFGPTRPPFPSTAYFDLLGANGGALVRTLPASMIESVSTIPTETWLTQVARKLGEPLGLLESRALIPRHATQELLPRQPFVLIPLQLADDLNALLYSPYKTPAEFLRDTIPALLDQGVKVVVKGHPGAAVRPYNIRKEVEALKQAKAFGPDVTVLPREIEWADATAVLAQAVAVCTVNSSMGFEALLLGKTCLLRGAALYDVQGRIQARGVRLARSEPERIWDAKLATLLMGSYLLPMRDMLSGEALVALARRALDENRQNGTPSTAFLMRWLEESRFGYRELLQVDTTGAAVRGPMFDARGDLVAAELELFSDHARLRATSSHDLVESNFDLRRGAFQGHLDECTVDANMIRLRGWAFDVRAKVAPTQVIVVKDRAVVAYASVACPRQDVAAVLGPDAAMSGFELETFFEGISGPLRLFLVSRGASIQELSCNVGSFHELEG